MIDNADLYYDFFGGGDGNNIIRATPSGGWKRASTDIENLEVSAIKCINIIDMHKKLK